MTFWASLFGTALEPGFLCLPDSPFFKCVFHLPWSKYDTCSSRHCICILRRKKRKDKITPLLCDWIVYISRQTVSKLLRLYNSYFTFYAYYCLIIVRVSLYLGWKKNVWLPSLILKSWTSLHCTLLLPLQLIRMFNMYTFPFLKERRFALRTWKMFLKTWE